MKEVKIVIRLQLQARDVTLLPEGGPPLAPDAAPERNFTIEHGAEGYRLAFDGRHVAVADEAMHDLLAKVVEGTPVEWRCSADPAIQSTFRPLSRILQCLNSTPSYQLFLAGFHIADSIGLLDPLQFGERAMADSFRYLVGPLIWTYGKKGRLFFVPEGRMDAETILELMANGKLFSADLYSFAGEQSSHTGNKLFTPYATPSGFSTRVRREAEDAWQRIGTLIRQQSGKYSR